MKYMFDYHIHTIYSSDGRSTLYDICSTAIERGLNEIAITDHFEPKTEDKSYKYYKPQLCLADVARANETFKGKLKIKMGVELGQPHLFLGTTKSLIDSTPFDYIIGSAHKLPGDMDVSEINYSFINIEDICEIYLNQIKQLVSHADFNCVGHMDLIKRYSVNYYRKRVTLTIQYELLKEILKILISKGKGIEINTSGLRQSPKETMPGVDVLKLYKELGGEILTIGSDAHCADDVAKGLDAGMENARQAGFNYLTVFEKREPQWISIGNEVNSFYIKAKENPIFN